MDGAKGTAISHTEALFLFYIIFFFLFSGWNELYLTLGTYTPLNFGWKVSLGSGHPISGVGSYSLSMMGKYIQCSIITEDSDRAKQGFVGRKKIH